MAQNHFHRKVQFDEEPEKAIKTNPAKDRAEMQWKIIFHNYDPKKLKLLQKFENYVVKLLFKLSAATKLSSTQTLTSLTTQTTSTP